MIFLTVGAQMPFDRLVRAVDDWAGDREPPQLFAQIGPSDYRPQHLRFEQFLTPLRFFEMMEQAALVIAHAGMGSIISALERGKPILVMPRRGSLGETRNDHQVATAQRFASLGAVHVAMDERELVAKLGHMAECLRSDAHRAALCRFADDTCPARQLGPCAPDQKSGTCPSLLGGLNAFAAGRPLTVWDSQSLVKRIRGQHK